MNRLQLRYYWILLFLAVVGASGLLQAQTRFSPEFLTNRPLQYTDDASSVGWNPGLLGLNLTDYEILLATRYEQKFDVNKLLYGAFAKIGPLGIGTMAPVTDSLKLIPRQYFAGFGVPILDNLWAGASARWLDGQGFGHSAQYTLAAVYRPLEALMTGVTFENLTGKNGSLGFNVQSAYNVTDWLTGYVSLHSRPGDTIGGTSAFGPTIGASIGLSDNHLQFSGQYDVATKSIHVGAEFALGSLGIGSINATQDSKFSEGVGLVRYSSESDIARSTPDIPSIPAVDDRGWAPERAYVPVGLEYAHQTTDAARNMEMLSKSCRPGEDTQFDSPSGVYGMVQKAGGSYAPLAAELASLTKDPNQLYSAIRTKYYTPAVKSRELSRGDTVSIISKQGYNVGIQNVDASKFPQVSVIMQVTDPAGKTVPGLGLSDFSFRDPSVKIVSVKPLDSTFNVPVDVVLIIDCSGSMSEEIAAVRANAESFANTLDARGANYRIGGVMYGSMIYDTLHPTPDLNKYKQFLSNAAAIGGDEITSLAVKAATEMNFRPNSQRIFVMITDDWAIQENSNLTEAELVPMLWNTRARLYSIIDPCRNNAPMLSRLALGSEYDIRSSFNSILDDIGKEITTTYELVYESQVKKEEIIPKVTILRGKVRDETGAPAGIPFTLQSGNGQPITVTTNPTTGEFETEIGEGKSYSAQGGGGKYIPLSETVDLSGTAKGDTVTRDFVLRVRPTMLTGRVLDENNNPVDAEVRIEDAGTLQQFDTLKAPGGSFSSVLQEGKVYRLTPSAKNYIPTPVELDTRGIAKGTQLTQDLHVMSIDAAIASGAVFKLKNIFFDFDKSTLKPESKPEIDKLVALLTEYPVIRVEIGAHTDSKGSDDYNLKLSGRRAQSVVDYMISKGIAQDRLVAKGYGETVPVASNETDEGRALNRRVEFKLIR